MPRMNVLNTVEREAFDSPPVFNSFPRQRLYIFKRHKGSDRSAWKIKRAGYADADERL